MQLYKVSIESDEYTTRLVSGLTGRHLLRLLLAAVKVLTVATDPPSSGLELFCSSLALASVSASQTTKPESLLARFCPAKCGGLTVETALSLFHTF